MENFTEDSLIQAAIDAFKKNDFVEANFLFEKYIEVYKDVVNEAVDYLRNKPQRAPYVSSKIPFRFENLNDSLVAHLKAYKPEVDIDETNEYYKYLRELRLPGIFVKEDTEERGHARKLTVYMGQHKLGFGKYKGKTINEIIEKDPHYIVWCIINLVHFSISDLLMLQEPLRNQQHYLRALEINLIKTLIKFQHDELEESGNYSYYLSGMNGSGCAICDAAPEEGCGLSDPQNCPYG